MTRCRISCRIFPPIVRGGPSLSFSAQPDCPQCPLLQRRQHDLARRPDGQFRHALQAMRFIALPMRPES